VTRLGRFLSERETEARLAFYPAILSVALGLFAQLPRQWLVWSLGALALLLAFEVLVFYTAKRVCSAGDHGSLLRKLPFDLPDSIARADRVDIISATLNRFTESRENLNAIKKARGRIRILMMNPSRQGLQVEALERQKAKRGADLSREISRSLQRLAETIGIEAVQRTVRLYDGAPHCAVYRLDERYIVTSALYGRGFSSPAVYLKKTGSHRAYCETLDESFEEVWEMSEAVPPDLFLQSTESESGPMNSR
jgi:hypothetical protein